jgi:membrane protein YqaA with SNARE-associated domain
MKERMSRLMLKLRGYLGLNAVNADGTLSMTPATIWRMGQWLVFANVLYLLALLPTWWPPQVQTGLLAAANCTLGSWVGYWIDVTAFKRIDSWETKGENIIAARSFGKAAIIAACIIACNIKLG